MKKAEPIRATPERAQHGQDVTLGRDGQRVQSGLAQLRQADHIEDCDVVAAMRWLAAHERAHGGSARWDESGVRGSGTDRDGVVVARLAALTTCREVRDGMPEVFHSVLVWFIGDGLSLREIARRRGIHHKTARRLVIATLIMLTDHFEASDAARTARGDRSRFADTYIH